MIWFRIDNRLIHGQIIETWLPYTRASRLVVCNATLASDMLQQQIMLLAVPSRITVEFLAPVALGAALTALGKNSEKVLVIFADCADARAAYESGAHFTSLNIGNMHYGPGKKQVCPHVAMSEADSTCLKSLTAEGVTLDFRCVPNDIADITEW